MTTYTVDLDDKQSVTPYCIGIMLDTADDDITVEKE